MYVFAMSFFFIEITGLIVSLPSISLILALEEKAGMDGTLPPTFLPGWHNEEKVSLSPFHTFEEKKHAGITLWKLRFDVCAMQDWVKLTF